MDGTLQRILEIATKFAGIPLAKLSAHSAVDQDMRIYGMDVWEFIDELAGNFGNQVRDWPWHRFACLSEGLGIGFPFRLIWQLITWPMRGTFEYPCPYERLELRHIAAVIEKGEWCEP